MIAPVDAHDVTGARDGHPVIAHLQSRVVAQRGLCGALLRGVDAPPDAERCIVCQDLSRDRARAS